MLSYYRDEKSFATSPTKSGRINGVAFGQTFSLPGGQGIVGYKAMIENFRGGGGYEFFENFGFQVNQIFFRGPQGEYIQMNSLIFCLKLQNSVNEPKNLFR